MAKLIQDGWCRIEGMVIPDLKETYGGPFTSIPDNTNIYYGAPEVQIFNKYSLVNGIVYKVVPISELSGFTTIQMIDSGYVKLQNDIAVYNKTVDISDAVNSAQYYYEPFVVDESSVIFYADSTKTKFDKFAIIYVDKYATPSIVTVSAKYIGNPVPVGDKFSLDDIRLHVIYADGNMALVKEGFTVEPEDRIITHLNSNIVKVKYVTPKNIEYVTQVAIEGVRNL